MPDNKNITHSLDAKRTDINDLAEIRNWCKSLGFGKSLRPLFSVR